MSRASGLSNLFVLSIAVAALLVACNDETSPTEEAVRTGAQGESCNATSDCDPGLVCIDRVCQTTGGGFPSGTDAGTSAPIVTRGQPGESCTARTDCESGLACIDNVCTSTPGASTEELTRGQAGESCAAHADCDIDLVCVNQVCSPPDVLLVGTEDAGAQVGTGKRGESCMTRADCEQGLICIENSCQPGAFNIQQTDKECVIIECLTEEDCCDPDDPYFESSTCLLYHDECALNGTPIYCDREMLFCTCQGHSCVDEKCVYEPPCTDASTCSLLPYGDGRVFCSADEVCVECTEDEDCGTDYSCEDNECVSIDSCETNLDCPVFHRCADSGCEEVGCTTDRECVAFTGNVLSICEDDECLQACETDLECSSPDNFQFRMCIGGFCEEVGCVTDEECRLRMNILLPVSSTVADIKCRDTQS